MIAPNQHAASASPDGRLRLDVETTEWRMSHTTYSPRLSDISAGRVLLDLWGEDWDAVVSWPKRGVAQLELRRYGTPGECTLLIDADAQTYRIGKAGDPQPLIDVKGGLERAFASQRPVVETRGWWTPPENYRPRWSNGRELGWIVVGPSMIPAGAYLLGQSILQWAMPGCYGRVLRPSVYEQFGTGGAAVIGAALGLAAIGMGTLAVRRAVWAWRTSRSRSG
jgi:hypothetical protein